MTDATMANAGTAAPTDTQEANSSSEPSWYLDDSTPGIGQRPDWMPAKYKKASDVGKAYQELERKLGAFTGAPENYDLTDLGLDTNNHTLKEAVSVAKELNMSQDGFNKFIGRIMSAQETESQVHLEEQVKKLGPDGGRMLTEFQNWKKDYLPPEQQEVVTEWIKTPEDLQAFNRIMANTHMSQVPSTATMHMSFEGVKDIKAELTKNLQRFQTDATYRKDWQSRMKRAHDRNPDS